VLLYLYGDVFLHYRVRQLRDRQFVKEKVMVFVALVVLLLVGMASVSYCMNYNNSYNVQRRKAMRGLSLREREF
jgi:hypothetical protein